MVRFTSLLSLLALSPGTPYVNRGGEQFRTRTRPHVRGARVRTRATASTLVLEANGDGVIFDVPAAMEKIDLQSGVWRTQAEGALNTLSAIRPDDPQTLQAALEACKAVAPVAVAVVGAVAVASVAVAGQVDRAGVAATTPYASNGRYNPSDAARYARARPRTAARSRTH